MPDVLAIVSKAVFEKEAKGLDVGDLWPTALYASTHAALTALSSGGRLFLVTVRPDHVLWLVGVLDHPRASRGAWRAAANTTKITDLTELIPRLRFANGKGLVRDAKLGMSLQTPRELAPDSAALLVGAADAAAISPALASGQVTPRIKSAPAPSAAKPQIATIDDAERPPGVPQAATWNAADRSWEHGATDERECRQGPWQSWRRDGGLRGECVYLDHDLHGTNRRYHPDGTIASEGRWEHGILRDATFFRAGDATDEPALRQGGAETVCAENIGDPLGLVNVTIRFRDAAGRQRDAYGELVPERPAGVPDTARWFSVANVTAPDGSSAVWVDGPTLREKNRKCQTWRWWSSSGQLLRTELMTESGKLQHVITLADDALERELDQFVAAPKERYFYLAMHWTPTLHQRLRARLASLPWSITREYLALLHGAIEEHHYVWSHKISRPREIIELVEDWERRAPPDASDVDAWFILGAGARAAYHLRDRDRTAQWWQRFAAIRAPKAYPEGTYAFGDFDDDMGAQGALRKEIDAWLSGRAAKAEAATAKKLSSPKTFPSVTDEELAQLVSARAGARPCEVILRAPEMCEAWLLDADSRTHYWSGGDLAPATVHFTGAPHRELCHLMQADACDERLLYWPGKHGWLSLQRYGRSVLWHAATYYVSRGQAEVERLMFFKASSPVEARRMMRLIAGPKHKPIDPWETAKLGPIFRIYKGDGIKSLAVKGAALVTRRMTLETFSSRQEAILAFEKIELERLRTGGMIERFVAESNRSR